MTVPQNRRRPVKDVQFRRATLYRPKTFEQKLDTDYLTLNTIIQHILRDESFQCEICF